MLVRVGYLVEINGIYSAGIVLKVVITVVNRVDNSKHSSW